MRIGRVWWAPEGRERNSSPPPSAVVARLARKAGCPEGFEPGAEVKTTTASPSRIAHPGSEDTTEPARG